MPHIDTQRLQRNANDIYMGNGQTAIRRAYVSASAGNPQFGIGDQFQYNEITFTGLFSYVNVQEGLQGGGTIESRQLTVTTREPINGRDYIVYNDTAYRAEGTVIPSVLGGVIQNRISLNLASFTGA